MSLCVRACVRTCVRVSVRAWVCAWFKPVRLEVLEAEDVQNSHTQKLPPLQLRAHTYALTRARTHERAHIRIDKRARVCVRVDA